MADGDDGESVQINPIAELVWSLQEFDRQYGVIRPEIGTDSMLAMGVRAIGYGLLALVSQGQQVNFGSSPEGGQRLDDAAKEAFGSG